MPIPGQPPSLGRIVHFHVNEDAARKLNSLGGKKYGVAEKCPAMIVRTLDNNACNLTLFPDAEEILHVANVAYSTGGQPGTWSYPERIGEAQEAAA
jgi:hypothetical protein